MTDDGFSIGELARRTGVQPGVLRTWEHRFDFPRGRRTDSGHRRFSDRDVALVSEVLAARDSGTPLKVAIGDVLARERAGTRPTVYGELTSRHPGARPQRLSRATLVAASRAIEDECLATSGHPLVLGAFQAGARFEEVRHRWDELARTASWCLAVADFDGDPPTPGHGRLALTHLPEDAPMRREWSVVCLGDDLTVVLSAWEKPGTGGKQYETVVSTDPTAVLDAARVLVGVARAHDTPVPGHVTERLRHPRPAGNDHAADRVLTRTLGYLDGLS